MFWANRITKVAGIAMLLLATLVIVDAVLETAIVGEANAMERADIEGMLLDINDSEALFFIGAGFALVADGLVLIAVATVLYLLFRDRSPALALFALVALLGASVAFVVADVAAAATGILAADFVKEGGAGGVGTGDLSTLQVARALGALWSLADLFGLTVLAAGLTAAGTLVAFAPAGQVNPPRWLGGLCIFSSVAMLLGWVHLANEDLGLILLTVGIVGTLLFIVILGGWLLLTRPQLEPGVGEGRPAVASA